MHLALSVPLSATALIWADVLLRAQPTERPPIFAPQLPTSTLETTPANYETSPPSRLSGRVRMRVTIASERVLAAAKRFEIPMPTPDPTPQAESLTVVPRNGPLMLPRYIVKSTALRRNELERPDLPLVQPYIIEREGRPGMATGYTFPLWRSDGGTRELNLNLVDFAGRGADHAKDFGRAEIEFKIKFEAGSGSFRRKDQTIKVRAHHPADPDRLERAAPLPARNGPIFDGKNCLCNGPQIEMRST